MMRFLYRAKLVRCVDGDTFDAELDLGFRMFAKVRFRLLDIDTPERGEPGFHECTQQLETLIREAEDGDGWFSLESRKTGKYGRWLATIPGVTNRMALWLRAQEF
jgi:micrococcal nuclease